MSVVATGFGGLHYADDGFESARAVVALHSLGTDHRLWTPVLPILLSRIGRVVRPDSRGHGRSAWGPLSSSEDWVADLDAVLDHAGVDQADLVGVSMGTAQALAYAMLRPDRVASVALADGFGRLEREEATAKVAALTGGAREQGMEAWARSYADGTVMAAGPECAELVRSAVAAVSLEAYTASAEACFAAPPGWEADVTAPALVLWGALDAKTPRWMSEQLADRIPNARMVEVPDAGHLSCLDNPTAFAGAVTDFLSRQSTQTADAQRS